MKKVGGGAGARPPDRLADLPDRADGLSEPQLIQVWHVAVDHLAATFEIAVSADLPGAALNTQAHGLIVVLPRKVCDFPVHREGRPLELGTGIQRDGARGIGAGTRAIAAAAVVTTTIVAAAIVIAAARGVAAAVVTAVSA